MVFSFREVLTQTIGNTDRLLFSVTKFGGNLLCSQSKWDKEQSRGEHGVGRDWKRAGRGSDALRAAGRQPAGLRTTAVSGVSGIGSDQ